MNAEDVMVEAIVDNVIWDIKSGKEKPLAKPRSRHRPPHNLKCKTCGSPFVSRRSHALYCKKTCFKNYLSYTRNMRFTQYGWTREMFDAQVIAQDSRCLICQSIPPLLVIDHDHRTGQVRGLLCVACNTALGLLRDAPESFKRALEYLKQALTSKEVINARIAS